MNSNFIERVAEGETRTDRALRRILLFVLPKPDGPDSQPLLVDGAEYVPWTPQEEAKHCEEIAVLVGNLSL